MPTSLQDITGVVADITGIIEAINTAKLAGKDEKTKQMEKDGLAALAKVEAFVKANGSTAVSEVDQTAYLNQKVQTLTAVVENLAADFHTRLEAFNQRADANLALAAHMITKVSKPVLFSDAELSNMGALIKDAQKALVNRKKLVSFLDATVKILALTASLAAKLMV
jgi:L-lactate utilization protein LutC